MCKTRSGWFWWQWSVIRTGCRGESHASHGRSTKMSRASQKRKPKRSRGVFFLTSCPAWIETILPSTLLAPAHLHRHRHHKNSDGEFHRCRYWLGPCLFACRLAIPDASCWKHLPLGMAVLLAVPKEMRSTTSDKPVAENGTSGGRGPGKALDGWAIGYSRCSFGRPARRDMLAPWLCG